jgi:hypothetical protein
MSSNCSGSEPPLQQFSVFSPHFTVLKAATAPGIFVVCSWTVARGNRVSGGQKGGSSLNLQISATPPVVPH